MTVRDILILPDKRLRLVSKPVAKIDAATRKLVEEMFETMYDAPGIGLAAIQIGEPRRIVTMDLAKKDEPKEPQVFINPELISHSAEKNVHEEGCLSIPEYYEEVERPAAVKLRYLDLDGKPHEIDADGLLATCIQHEIDHLRVDEHLRLLRLVLLGEIHGDDAPGLADLDRSEADAGRVVHGRKHVLDQLPDRGVDLGDRLGNQPQPLVRQNQDVPHRHGRDLRFRPHRVNCSLFVPIEKRVLACFDPYWPILN